MITPQSEPKVTIAIPTFNRATMLTQAIDSALSQTYSNIEVIISDNCSADNTKEILLRYNDPRIKTVTQSENLGMEGNWNFCLENATGDYFLLLSDDDILEPDAIQNLISGFDDARISFVYGLVIYADSDGNPSSLLKIKAPQFESGKEFIFNALKGKRVAFPSATLHRTVVARSVGGYPSVGTATDFGLLLMLALDGIVSFVAIPVTRYRIHDECISLSNSDVILSQLSLIQWVEATCVLNEFKNQLFRYSIKFIYKWGRSQTLRGNNDNSATALSALQSLKQSDWWTLLFLAFNCSFVQKLAALRRWLRQRVF